MALAFSPDGAKIAFTVADGSGTTGIWVMNADGSGVTQLTGGSNEDEEPGWSPDGTRIVFSRDSQIWVINANGTGQVRLTSKAIDGDPVWSPDGSKIAFTRGPNGNRQIYVLFVANPSDVRLRHQQLGENENLDWVRKP